MNMKTVTIERVSSKEQDETGYSLPAQQKLLAGYAVSKGLTIAKPFTITESASGKKQREIFNSVFDYVKKNNIKIIVVEKADRFTRNFKDTVDLWTWLNEDEERQLHSVKDSLILHKNSRSQEKLNWDIRIVFAKNYVDNLSEEVKKGQKEKLAQGWLPTRPPIGYITVGEKGHKIHIVDEKIKPLVQKMFKLYATGEYSLVKLTKIMEEDGLRNAQKNKIVKSRIHQYLTDPFYIGMNRWNDKLHQGKQEPLISEELFDKVQSVLKSKNTPKYRTHFHLFKALIKCEECRGSITWEIHKGIVYGHCNHYKDCKQKTWSVEKEVEEQILKNIGKLKVNSPRLAEWIRKALKESHKDEIEYHSSSVGELTKRHNTLKNRIDAIYEDKLDGKITLADYDRLFEKYGKEIKQLDKKLGTLGESTTKFFRLSSDFYDISQRGNAIYKKAKTIEKKRSLIKLVFRNLTLNEGKLRFEFTEEYQLLYEAVQKTNSSKQLKMLAKAFETFEQREKTDLTAENDAFVKARPILLPREDSNLEP
jgi:DNA invertase Pin-like site-specific DNA recombinase